MSKTLKDAKTEKETRKQGKTRWERKRPPVKEKGGHRSIQEVVGDDDLD
jgi:hypothetical protein